MSFRPALVLALVAGLAACDGSGDPGPEQRADAAFTYAAPMAAGNTLYLRNTSGSIKVEPSTDDTLRVVADLKWRGDAERPTDVSLRGETLAGAVLVCAIVGDGRCTVEDYESKSDGTGFSIGSGGVKLGLGGSKRTEVHYRVQVPTGVRLDIVMLDGDVTSASTAPAKVGGVNGRFVVVTSVGPVSAKLVNGDVDARMTTLSGSDSVEVEVVNGSAALYLPESVAATVDVGTVNGTMLTDFPLQTGRDRMVKQLTATLGAGTTPVRVRAVNGDVQLRRLDAQGKPYPVAP